jgi:hypothetical protein
MKATLKFKLPQDYEEYRMAVDASAYHHILFNLDQWLRGKIKYPADDMSDEKYNTYQEVRDKLHELIADQNIDLW